MELRKIRQLIELMQKMDITEVEIHEGKESIRISGRNPVSPIMTPDSNAVTPIASEQVAETSENKHTIYSPMVGTVHLSPTPDSKPFVEIGQQVKVGDVMCLIEAMKMPNQIHADKAGTVTAMLVDNESAVEFGQPLFTIS